MNRLATITEKIDRERTGLAAAIYVHVDYDPVTLAAHAVRVSTRRKENDNTLDQVVTAMSDVVTDVLTTLRAKAA